LGILDSGRKLDGDWEELVEGRGLSKSLGGVTPLAGGFVAAGSFEVSDLV